MFKLGGSGDSESTFKDNRYIPALQPNCTLATSVCFASKVNV